MPKTSAPLALVLSWSVAPLLPRKLSGWPLPDQALHRSQCISRAMTPADRHASSFPGYPPVNDNPSCCHLG
jgi:hypothetical protein